MLFMFSGGKEKGRQHYETVAVTANKIYKSRPRRAMFGTATYRMQAVLINNSIFPE